MNNAELIKALRYCSDNEKEEGCDECPYLHNGMCRTMLSDAAYALEAADKRIVELEAQIPKDGEWIDMGDFAMCSVCKIAQRKKNRQYNGGFMWVRTDFCPSCGSRMAKGEQE
jgi:hypothetical protein